jgi:hypothetical protein
LAFSAHIALRLFPCGRRFPVELPSPEPASSRFILPWRPSSSEFLRFHLPPNIFRCRPHRPGSRPSSRHPQSASTLLRRVPSLRFVPSSGFLNLSTVCSAPCVCELVSSRSHVQGCRRSGASLPAQPFALVERRFPLAVASSGPHQDGCGLPFEHSTRRRLPIPKRSASRPFSARGRVACGPDVSPRRSPLPSSVFISSRSCLAAVSPGSPEPSAHNGSSTGSSLSRSTP